MEKTYFVGESFSKPQSLQSGEYEDCVFQKAELESQDLTGCKFVDCVFEDSNLSLATLKNTSFQKVHFKNCKLQGLHFEYCNPFLFEVSFEACQLNLSSFYKIKTKGTRFNHCNLREVDFSEADFTLAIFDYCDLQGAIFDQSILEKADFRLAESFQINPSINRMKKAKFASNNIHGLISHLDILIDEA
ncbi:MAG: Adenylate cyclase [Bacteroidota bacterium]|jgi:uncharacterized protein YjbI with pentapeptide repeats